jgi:creatinine amidohydrolase
MRLDELNWMDVESYLAHDDRLMIVVGACEQHGYLSLLTDVSIPQALADAASQRSGVLIAPPLNFGVSPYFLTYPGTISFRVSTFLDALEDIVRSVYGVGFRRLVFLNGHGGNEAGRARLTELSNQLPGLHVAWYSWWVSHSVEAVAMQHTLKSYHAAWIEAFPFTMVGDLPEGEKRPVAPVGILNAEQTRQAYGDGVFGGPYQASPEIMNQVFEAALADVLYLLDENGAVSG